MGDLVTFENIATTVTFVAPGYLALSIYSAIYAKRDRNFSRLLVESVVYSLPLIVLTNYLWQQLLQKPLPTGLNTGYVTVLLLTAVIIGYAVSLVRVRFPIKQLLNNIGFGHPDGDFIRRQFARLRPNQAVTLTLKDGTVFSGTPESGKIFVKGEPERYYFNNIAFPLADGSWQERNEGILVDLKEVEYITTPKLAPDKPIRMKSFWKRLESAYIAWHNA